MKNVLFCLLWPVCASATVWAQSPVIGGVLPPFSLDRVINSSQPTFKSTDAKGKLLIIEFWGTWCAPCLPALTHLDSLQKRFPNELRVIAISDDSPERLQKFLARRPVSIPLASDPKGVTQELFNFNTVPHTIVADQNQRILAITTPDQLSEKIIHDFLEGHPVSLTTKRDAPFDPKKDYFSADSATQFSAQFKDYMQGLPSFSRLGQGPFKDRRITFINVSANSIVQRIYGLSRVRMKDKRPKELTNYEPANLICFDLIVPEKSQADLNKIAIREVEKKLPVRTQIINEDAAVYVLTRDKNQSALLPSTQANSFSFSGSGIKATNSKMSVLQDFLENTLQRPVVDETGLDGRYDFVFDTRQEDLKQSLSDGLKKLGLTVTEAHRNVDFLILQSK